MRAQPARFFLCCPRCHSWVLDVLHHHRSCLTIVPVVCAKKINGSVSRHHHGRRRTHTNAETPLCRDGRVNEASRPSHHVLVSICKFNPVSNFGTPQHHVTHSKTLSLCVCVFCFFFFIIAKWECVLPAAIYYDSFELSMCRVGTKGEGLARERME